MKFLVTLVLIIFALALLWAQTTILARYAGTHVGETVSITDTVYGGKLLPSNMTLIDLGGRYPHQALTIMIPAADRVKFAGMPEVDWKNMPITVTGTVISYHGKPEIVVSDPKQVLLTPTATASESSSRN